MLRETTEKENREQLTLEISTFQTFLTEQLQIPISIGVGQRALPHQLNSSFNQAERALKTANHPSLTVFADDLTIVMIIEEVRLETKKAFIDRTITPIIGDKDLFLTIQKWFELNLSLKKTASELHIHINTLHYRAKKDS